MRGYKLSFLLGALLILGSFVALYRDRYSESGLKNEASYFLLIGGIALGLVGWGEYNDKKKLENKINQD